MELNFEIKPPLYAIDEKVRDIVSRKVVTVRTQMINLTATNNSQGTKTSVTYTYICEYESGWLCELAQDFIEPQPKIATLPASTKPRKRRKRRS